MPILSKDAEIFLKLNKEEMIITAKCYVVEIMMGGINPSDLPRQRISGKLISYIYDGTETDTAFRFGEINKSHPEDSNESDYTFNFAEEIKDKNSEGV
jgi:hypothetical protein